MHEVEYFILDVEFFAFQLVQAENVGSGTVLFVVQDVIEMGVPFLQ
jgi:hypothetical protein